MGDRGSKLHKLHLCIKEQRVDGSGYKTALYLRCTLVALKEVYYPKYMWNRTSI